MSQIEAVISDADGTLVDTVDLIRHGQHKAATTFLKQHGLQASDIPSYEDYEILLNKLVGGSARQTLERTVKAFYKDKTHYIESVDYDELNALLDPIQDRLAPAYVREFPGLADVLSQIGALGLKLAIFTSGTPHHIVRNFGIALDGELGDYSYWLDAYKDVDNQTQLHRFEELLKDKFHIPAFTVVTCDDTGEHTKPDPLSIQIALERLGTTSEHALALGDHAYDMQAAVNAGISRRVGITHGFDDEDVLRKAGATNVITSLPELSALLVD